MVNVLSCLGFYWFMFFKTRCRTLPTILCIMFPYSLIPVANDSAPEHALRPGFLSTFALATDQGSKLGLSKNKSIICYYNTYQVVQFNRLPLVVSFIASSNANTGLIVSLEKELAPLFEELIKVVEGS
ncbi:ragulator complex protein LAMTOR3 isoform X1 [Grammomys surdaster]|uniref:ragulator complex protein LAMTOR3 isoform X1 n=1 Tax=Grammomys surdaster TaxID=491861 RepID=UPI00109FE4CE|nr:ragulator complex protein LAMTOR3 isoform X1 [Grammomys surdaster]